MEERRLWSAHPTRHPTSTSQELSSSLPLSRSVLPGPLPRFLPVYMRTFFPLLSCPWGTGPKIRASETSSGQGTPEAQDLLPLSWGYVEGDLNLAILGWMPELHICSHLKPNPKIIGRRPTQATPAGRRWENGPRASWPAGSGQGGL